MTNAEYIARLRTMADGPNRSCAAWALQALREVAAIIITGIAPAAPPNPWALKR